MPKWYGVTHHPVGLSGTANVWLNDGLKPNGLVMPRSSSAMWRIVGMTISGANGSDATTAQGATVPSSGPYGAPRGRESTNCRSTPLTVRFTQPGPSQAVKPQQCSP